MASLAMTGATASCPCKNASAENYLFAAKAGGWGYVKSQYDMNPQETVPFLNPPQNLSDAEIENAEKIWSQSIALEDWMIGPRAMGDGNGRTTEPELQR